MIAATVVLGAVLLALAVFAGWSVKTQVRRHTRKGRLLAERIQRAPEDVCWRYCRDDAYQQALYLALRRRVDEDPALLRDLGVQADGRLEVVR